MLAPVLIYIHGFHSSPLSQKVQQMKQYVAQQRPDIIFECPQMPCFPLQAWALIESIVARYPGHKLGFIGSSLGGYLVTKASAEFGANAVLINPAVRPYELLVDYLGENTHPYTEQVYTLTIEHMADLKSLEVEPVTHPERLWLLTQMGDEILDYRQAVNKHQLSKTTIEQGGDHSFIGFERYLDPVLRFLDL
ncbi:MULTISPECIES: esterase YqiA [unclassified Motilimonas]|uniref:esterase YqiA n=1 Tax=unclassified Motilimonas TaxID=2643697 RepID=UPI001E48BF0C|nr:MULTISPECIES: esterase YqiA [unclassified Motilimonas]MDO6525609.1 esterase YqiA [Motilimonas sp. 1_MG-2023]